MKNNIFRKKNLDRIASPEKLNDYIHVSNPSIWLILSALIIIIISVFIWSLSGNITTKVDAKGIVKASEGSPDVVLCYVSPESASTIKKNMEVHICGLYSSDNRYIVGKVANVVNMKISRDDLGSISPDEWSSEMLIPDNMEYAVPIMIKFDMDSSSGQDEFRWVDGDIGDASFVTDNNICRVGIITESVTPIRFLISPSATNVRGA